MLVEEALGDGQFEGRAEHQAPDVDGTVLLTVDGGGGAAPGDIVTARVTGSDGADLLASRI